ncbi:MAG: response regulator [Planctomycetes bacterium]|nr:response regulator [Planctomycetota bacterium]
MRVLIVDDNRNLARFLKGSLATHGYTSRAVSSVSEAIAAAMEDKYDLFLIDIGMPDGDGRELAGQFISAFAVTPDRIVFITARDRSEVCDVGHLTTHPVLHKPFRLSGLLDLVRKTAVHH